jgi:hypothetical protein
VSPRFGWNLPKKTAHGPRPHEILDKLNSTVKVPPALLPPIEIVSAQDCGWPLLWRCGV